MDDPKSAIANAANALASTVVGAAMPAPRGAVQPPALPTNESASTTRPVATAPAVLPSTMLPPKSPKKFPAANDEAPAAAPERDQDPPRGETSDVLAAATRRSSLFHREKKLGLGLLTVLLATFGGAVWWRVQSESRKAGEIARELPPIHESPGTLPYEAPTVVAPNGGTESLASMAPTRVGTGAAMASDEVVDGNPHSLPNRSYMPRQEPATPEEIDDLIARDRMARRAAEPTERSRDEPNPLRTGARPGGKLVDQLPDDELPDARPKRSPRPTTTEATLHEQPAGSDEARPSTSTVDDSSSSPPRSTVRHASADNEPQPPRDRVAPAAQSSVSDDAIPAAPRSFQPPRNIRETEPAGPIHDVERAAPAWEQTPPTTPTIKTRGAPPRSATPATHAVEPVHRSSPGTYVVQTGDNYWTIADRAYGSGEYFRALMAYNKGRLKHIARVQPGEELLIPDASELRARFPNLCPE